MTLKVFVAGLIGSVCFICSMTETDRTQRRLFCIEGVLWFILSEVAR